MRLTRILHEAPAGSFLLIAVRSVVRLSAVLTPRSPIWSWPEGLAAITAQRSGACIQSNSARASRGRTRRRTGSAIIQSDNNGGDE
jgi:hypothetical protein